MKKAYLITILLAICTLVMQSCGQSREEKAEAIAKKTIPAILNDASTYEPIQTNVDSAFATIYCSPKAVSAAYELLELKSNEDDLKRQYNFAKSLAANWSLPIMSTYSKEQLRQAKEKMSEIEKMMKKVADDKSEQEQIIKEENKNVDPSKFFGWIITHRFRCANAKGVKEIQDVAILVDPKMENTLMLYNLDDDADDGMKKVTSVIDEVIEE